VGDLLTDPDSYELWLKVSEREAELMIAGAVPEAVRAELSELVANLRMTPAETVARLSKKKRIA